VRAALGEAMWSGVVVGSVECTIDGTVVCALDNDTVVCALGDSMVICALHDGTVICAIDDGTVICAMDDGTVICALDDALFLFFFLLYEVDFVKVLGTVEVSAVAGDMIERSLIQLPVMVIRVSNWSGFRPEKQFRLVPDLSKKPNHMVMAGL